MGSIGWRSMFVIAVVCGLLADSVFGASAGQGEYSDPAVPLRQLSEGQRFTVLCFRHKGLRYIEDYRFGRVSREWWVTPSGMVILGQLGPGWKRETIECIGLDI